MTKRRLRNHTPAFKAKVALDAIKGVKKSWLANLTKGSIKLCLVEWPAEGAIRDP